MTATIPLYGNKAAGRVALVDDADYELVSQYRWHVNELARRRVNGLPGRKRTYVVSWLRINGRKQTLYMHSLITGYPQVDHIDHDGLNNRQENLRPATTTQNNRNRRPAIGCSSRYRGVHWHRARGKWQVKIQAGQGSRHLGYFDCEEDAADAYDQAALAQWGEYAYLNNARVVTGDG